MWISPYQDLFYLFQAICPCKTVTILSWWLTGEARLVRLSSQSQKFSDVSFSLKQMASKTQSSSIFRTVFLCWLVAWLIKILSSPSLNIRARSTSMVILMDVVESKVGGDAGPGNPGGLPISTEMQSPPGLNEYQFLHSHRKAGCPGQTSLILPSFDGIQFTSQASWCAFNSFVFVHWRDWWWQLLNEKIM